MLPSEHQNNHSCRHEDDSSGAFLKRAKGKGKRVSSTGYNDQFSSEERAGYSGEEFDNSIKANSLEVTKYLDELVDHPPQSPSKSHQEILDFEVSESAMYIRNILDKFPSADIRLAERLGESNWQRHVMIRNRNEGSEIDIGQEVPRSVFQPTSIFHDSGLGSSMPTTLCYAASLSSFMSKAGDADNKYFRVPQTPKEVVDGLPFECFICRHMIIHIKNRIDWKMHVFADIRPYICTFSCKDALCTFATRNDWAEHEFKYHLGRNSWPCPKCPATSDNADELRSHLVEAHLAAADPSMLKPTITPIGELKCPLCQKGLGDSKRNYISHVAKHMESIALAALPPDPEDISDDDSNGAEKVGSILTGRSNTVDSIPSSPLQKMDDFPGTHSQRHSFTATNSYDLKLSTRIHPSVWQASFHMPSASSDAPSRPYSLEGSALYNPTPMDFQGFGTCQFPGRDIPGRDILFGAESNFHMNSTAGIASPPSGSFTTGPPPFSLYATAEDKTSASFTSVWNPRSFSHGSVMHNLSTIDDSPTVLDHPIKFLDSQLSFPTPLEDPLRQLLHPQITSSISPLDYSTGLERLSPSVTGNPVGPQQSKVASNSRKHRLNETSETSDKSFKMADRFSLEIDNTARDHSLYQNVTVHSDGLYHCPWEGQDGCQHRPEKLKCNYEYATPNFYSLNFIDSANNPAYASQFVDLHLKPYRCKDLTCENLHFSSPACLRRHEGKAHAMHGYGDKPFLCTFKGCERGVAGNGFPRHWNLRDHIKRVHPELGNVNPYI